MPHGIRTRRDLEDDNDWMTSFGDVISILLAFFVMLLQVSSLDVGKLEEMSESMQSLTSDKQIATPFTDIRDGVFSIIDNKNMSDSVSVELKPDGVYVEFSDLSLFKQGKAELGAEAVELLKSVASVIVENSKSHYMVEVEGHTDDIPIHNAEFKSNWELSSARATGVVRLFQSEGVDPFKLKGAAFADTRPKHKIGETGLSDSDVRAANRRIVVVVHR